MSSDNQISPDLKFNLDVTCGLAIALNVILQLLDERGILPMGDTLEVLHQQHSNLNSPEQRVVAHGVNILISSLEHAVRDKQPGSKLAH
ncbi:hypothetical protein HCO87_002382 [Salmonella enterica subsp. enterica serovar Reading]|nr:hypothetical protein [Salmonella enterica subsp. enterica serovar Reading]